MPLNESLVARAMYIVALPTLIAGGRANCSMRMNWYSASDPTSPRLRAALMTAIPIRGNAMYRTSIIPSTVRALTPELLKPETSFDPV